MRRALVPVWGAVVIALAGCAAADAPDPSGVVVVRPTPSADTPAGAPIVFALHCGGVTYTTYDAAWDARTTTCTVSRLAGDEPSAQQASAVAAADGAATIDELAATCAEVGSAAWTGPVADADAARLAEGLLRYCPGHPQADRLRNALTTYRG
jgi:hypothetical protein